MVQPNIIELATRIDNVTSPLLEAQINTVLDTAPSALILDLTNVTFVSSIGLRVLLTTAKSCRKQNVQLALHSVSPQIVELLSLSGLSSFFPVYPTRETALSSFV